MKNVVIYGKPSCPYCVKAKDLCVDKGIEYTYINIVDAGINGEKLSKICGETVTTVPQIFIDGKFNKGGYTGLEAAVKEAGL